MFYFEPASTNKNLRTLSGHTCNVSPPLQQRQKLPKLHLDLPFKAQHVNQHHILLVPLALLQGLGKGGLHADMVGLEFRTVSYEKQQSKTYSNHFKHIIVYTCTSIPYASFRHGHNSQPHAVPTSIPSAKHVAISITFGICLGWSHGVKEWIYNGSWCITT